MGKDNLRLVSVRIAPDTLAKIDKFIANHYYWKRNTVINGLLTSLVHVCTEGQLYELARYNPHNPSNIKIEVRIIKE